MIHLRLVVPVDLTETVVAYLISHAGVAHVMRFDGAGLTPTGDVVLCDLAREASNDVVEWLQRQRVHTRGAIALELPDAVVSDAAERADARAPGAGPDALIWEQVEARVRDETRPTASYLVFMIIAAVIALIGILLDSPILIVGAMVVGPDYGPVAATCVALARRRYRLAAAAFGSLALGLGLGALGSLVAAVVLSATGLGPGDYALTDRELTAFIARPDGLAAVVAVLAGIVGMLSLTQSRSGALVGVLVSVTTIPAVANIGAATAFGEWNELGGAALQLAINVVGLLVAGLVTLRVQDRLTTRPTARSGRSVGR